MKILYKKLLGGKNSLNDQKIIIEKSSLDLFISVNLIRFFKL